MKIDGFLESIDTFASFKWAEQWDNSGLMIRSLSDEVHKVGVTLDLDMRALSIAKDAGCDCILTHHPLIFSPLSSIDSSTPSGKLISEIVSSGISVISCHTNWDNSPVGMNVALSRTLGLLDIEPLIPDESKGWGVGAVGRLFKPQSSFAFTQFVKTTWCLDFLRFFGDLNKQVEKIALCGGSGGDLWREALKVDADIYITADIKYHDTMDSLSMAVPILQLDHGEMEWVSMAELAYQTSLASGIDTILLDRPDPVGIII